MDEFSQLMAHFNITQKEDLDALRPIVQFVDRPKYFVLAEYGVQPENLMVLLDGVLRGYVTYESGKEVTDCFGFRYGDAYIGDVSPMNPVLVRSYAQTLSPCRFAQFSLVQLEPLFNTSTRLLQVLNRFTTYHNMQIWEHRAVLYMNADERYEWFLKAYPGLVDRIPLKYIASFLNMTNVTLSNVRHR